MRSVNRIPTWAFFLLAGALILLGYWLDARDPAPAPPVDLAGDARPGWQETAAFDLTRGTYSFRLRCEGSGEFQADLRDARHLMLQLMEAFGDDSRTHVRSRDVGKATCPADTEFEVIVALDGQYKIGVRSDSRWTLAIK
jgi:hypothetical protein